MTAMQTNEATMNAKQDDQEQYLLNAISVVGPWSVHDDDDGRLFYYNHETNESQWTAPDGLHGLEGEFMMKLMLQEAIARSGVWSAHDAGNGTLYYFNEKTRESVWERPANWGVETDADQKELPPPPPALPPKKQREERTLEGKAPVKAKKEKKSKTKKHEEQPEDTPREPTPEELALQQRREEDRKRYSEQFCDMLRDKKIMPFCKWSVAFPQIATDPRFLAVPTMDERREIFEDFVQHRRTDLKSEKKQKLKDAKKRFTKFLRDHFAAQRLNGAFDPKLTLSLFLATWEDVVDPGQLKAVKEEALAFLPLAVQEKLWDKEMSTFLGSTNVEREEEDRLRAYLMDKLSDRQYISWDDLVIQDNVRGFYSTLGAPATLSEALQRVVVNQVAKKLAMVAAEAKKSRVTAHPEEMLRPSRDGPTLPAQERSRNPDGESSRRQAPSHDRRETREERPRSRERRRRSASSSRSRSRSRGRARSRSHSRRGSRHRSSRYGSRSSSRSRSRSSSRSRSRSRRR